MKFKQFAMALLLSTSLVGCGTVSTGITPGLKASSGSSISRAESVQFDSLNNGQLNELEDEDLQELDGTDSPEAAEETAAFTTQSFLSNTKIGYVRSEEDGKYFLQFKEGTFTKRSTANLTLNAQGNKVSEKLASQLNHKVLIRGTTEGTTFTVKGIYAVPDLSILLDILRTGAIKGTTCREDHVTYSTRDNGILGSNYGGITVTARSVSTKLVYRAISSKKDGYYKIRRMPPGEYTVEATLDGYQKGIATVTVAKRKSTQATLTVSRKVAGS